ncbi:MAG: hypothetical protein AAGG00_14745 [Cyanobacteria bacterium P01_H01_bin.150]
MQRLISQLTGFMSSIQSLFSRVEYGSKRSTQFAEWLRSFNWREDEDDDEDEDEDE